MSALVDQLVAQVIGLEVGLLSCQARLAAVTDDEALHDLRTTVRRLRSLLRPLRGLPGGRTTRIGRQYRRPIDHPVARS
jgi:CHAD domain-containing protein